MGGHQRLSRQVAVALLPLVLFAVSAVQAYVCTQWQVVGYTQWAATQVAACSAAVGQWQSGQSERRNFSSYVDVGGQCRATYEQDFCPNNGCWGPGESVLGGFTNRTGDYCLPEQCDSAGFGKTFTQVTGVGGGNRCDSGSHCLASPVSQTCLNGGPDCLTVYRVSSFECENGEPEISADDEQDEKCLTVGDLEFCKNHSQGADCGYVNDQFVCLKSTANKDKCFEHTDGSMICAQGTPIPPAPDSGTPGVPATPDQVVNITNGSTTSNYNYYNNTTVNNSSRPAGGENPGGSTGTGDSDGECEGDDCGPGEGGELDGDGDWFDEPSEPFSFTGAMQSFVASAQALPAFQTATTFFDVNVGGTCPVWSTTIETFGTIAIDAQCSSAMGALWPFIAAIVIATAGFYAFRIAFL